MRRRMMKSRILVEVIIVGSLIPVTVWVQVVVWIEIVVRIRVQVIALLVKGKNTHR